MLLAGIHIIFFFIPSLIFAQEQTDSLHYQLNEVLVSGLRIPTTKQQAPSSLEIISLEKSTTQSLGNILQQTSGIFLKSYGGGSAIQTISSRGMGAEYTLILVDGQRLTNFQNGLVDFGIISTNNIEKIEIAKGGYSALFGADAVGGIINIITKKPTDTLQFFGGIGIGSEKFQQYTASISGGNSSIQWRSDFSKKQSNENHQYYYNSGVEKTLLTRKGTQYNIIQFNNKLNIGIDENIKSFFSGIYEYADRGSPAAVTNPNPISSAFLIDKNFHTQGGIEWTISPALQFSTNTAFHYTKQTYNDSLLIINGNPLHSYYDNKLFSITPQIYYSISSFHTIIAGIEFVHASIVSNEVKNKNREQYSAFISSKNFVDIHEITEIIFYPSIRFDKISDVSKELTPKLGANVGFKNFSYLRLRASYGNNFRVPTFNDLYWKEGGSPKLKPEYSQSFDCGIISSIDFLGNVDIEANYFSINTKDRILWKPTQSGIWSPTNISKVLSQGIELQTRWNVWNDNIALSYSYTLMNTLKKSLDFFNDATFNKQLPYTPQELATVQVTGKYENIFCGISHRYIGFRYTTENNDAHFILSSFHVADVNIGTNIFFENVFVKIQCAVDNIFNTDYQIIQSYPMPLRTYKIFFNIEY